MPETQFLTRSHSNSHNRVFVWKPARNRVSGDTVRCVAIILVVNSQNCRSDAPYIRYIH
ncbi:MAG: hypothetical protein HC849_09525 [Oscillatoriales cyanobacterium RU_3_3]|nr:hypothetical protein [Microcoleus sp. SM1_3_4]NJM60372.1 hypothetical protein [Oscillatoriales cyanobacterium RU_3_3]NJR21857.1 hypothetical protein [Richelia sp. CSU_2_1]